MAVICIVLILNSQPTYNSESVTVSEPSWPECAISHIKKIMSLISKTTFFPTLDMQQRLV